MKINCFYRNGIACASVASDSTSELLQYYYNSHSLYIITLYLSMDTIQDRNAKCMINTRW